MLSKPSHNVLDLVDNKIKTFIYSVVFGGCCDSVFGDIVSM